MFNNYVKLDVFSGGNESIKKFNNLYGVILSMKTPGDGIPALIKKWKYIILAAQDAILMLRGTSSYFLRAKTSLYMVGTTIRVKTVAKDSPKIMVITRGIQKAGLSPPK